MNYHLLRIDDETRWKNNQISIPIFGNTWASTKASTVLRYCFGEPGEQLKNIPTEKINPFLMQIAFKSNFVRLR